MGKQQANTSQVLFNFIFLPSAVGADAKKLGQPSLKDLLVPTNCLYGFKVALIFLGQYSIDNEKLRVIAPEIVELYYAITHKPPAHPKGKNSVDTSIAFSNN